MPEHPLIQQASQLWDVYSRNVVCMSSDLVVEPFLNKLDDYF